MSEKEEWIIVVGGGVGNFTFEGTEEEAEEMRRHKANWEHAIARKFRVKDFFSVVARESDGSRWVMLEEAMRLFEKRGSYDGPTI